MATTITSTETNALVAAVGVIADRINGAIAFQSAVDAAKATAGIYGLPNDGAANLVGAGRDHRTRLAAIREDGKRMLDGPLAAMGRKCSSRAVDGENITDYPRLFRDISADLLGGTPDYVSARGKTMASNPAASAKGIFRRLLVDHLGEPIDDGWHGGTKIVRIRSKPVRYQSVASIEGPPNPYSDALAYRGGRTSRILTGYVAVNDSQQPSGIFNPYLTPSDLTHGASVTSITSWTLTNSGSAVVLVDTGVLWRGRTYSIKFRGPNTSYLEIEQVIPASVFANGYIPWDLGIPVRLETGWQGTITVTWGSESQSFTHADLTNGAFKHLFLDLDKDLYPVNFDSAGAKWKIRFTNDTNNSSNAIYIAGVLPYQMLNFEGHWYSHYSDESEPTVEQTESFADSLTVLGKVNDVLSFVYHDLAPGWAHLPSSGTATIADPAFTPEISATYGGSNLADGGTIALGSVATGAHVVPVIVTNSGTGALSIGVPTNGTDSNIASVTFSQSVPKVLLPGESYTLTITVTDGGAGAFSTVITAVTNDSDENPFNFTISGSAT